MLSFGLFGVVFAFIAIIAIGGMLTHALLFGSVFYAATRQISRTFDELQAKRETTRAASNCEFCGATRPTSAVPCPACGAPQQHGSEHAAVDRNSHVS